MVKFIIEESSDNGKFTHQGRVSLEASEDVYPIEIRAILRTVTNVQFQEGAKSMLRNLCKKHHIPLEEIPGL